MTITKERLAEIKEHMMPGGTIEYLLTMIETLLTENARIEDGIIGTNKAWELACKKRDEEIVTLKERIAELLEQWP